MLIVYAQGYEDIRVTMIIQMKMLIGYATMRQMRHFP